MNYPLTSLMHQPIALLKTLLYLSPPFKILCCCLCLLYTKFMFLSFLDDFLSFGDSYHLLLLPSIFVVKIKYRKYFVLLAAGSAADLYYQSVHGLGCFLDRHAPFICGKRPRPNQSGARTRLQSKTRLNIAALLSIKIAMSQRS